MGIDASIIFNTAIIQDSRTIEKYLIEEQKKSNNSPQVFFGLLLSHTKKISISKEIEYLKGRVLELTYELKIFDLEDAPTLSNLSREYNRTKKTKKLEEAKSKAINYELFNEIVNRLWEQSISGSEVNPNADDSNVEDEEVPLENKFNGMSMKQVRSFFMPLVTKKNRGGKHWMTEDDFEIFLKTSFLKIDLTKPKINIGKSDKGAIKKLFFLFYEECLNESFSENNSKDRFVTLLKNAFNTPLFDDLTNDTFQKRDSKYEWGM